jgi:cell division septal protein FtsQ
VTRRRAGRRSQRRLGTQYYSTAQRTPFSLAPAAPKWQAVGPRLMAALLLVILGWTTYYIFSSPRFYVYGVEVQGNVLVAAEEVYAATELEGVSIFWVDSDQTAARVEALPSVKSAQVKVRLPAQVVITIEERNPEFVWQIGDAQWWIDVEGTVIPSRTVLSNTLTIIDIDAQPVSPGQALDPSIIGISFNTPEGWPVHLGDGQNMDAKLTILINLRKDLLARGTAPEFIDIRFVEKPFYK